MRILFVLHQFYPEFSGGTERITLNLARGLQRAGHQVQVLACALGNPPGARPSAELAGALERVVEGVPVLVLPRSLLPGGAESGFAVDARLVATIRAWLEAREFDIAHVTHTMRAASAVLALQQAGLPYLLTLTDFFPACYRINLMTLDGARCAGPERGTRCDRDCGPSVWTDEALRARYRQGRDILAGAALRVCPSEFVARQYRHDFPELDFAVLPHGLDILGMLAAQPQPRAPHDGLHLAYAGTLIPQKGLDVLLRALAQVDAPGLRLTVMGARHGDPSYHDDVDLLMAADPRVIDLGEVSQAKLFGQLKNADLLCLPTRVPETFSLTLNEAAALGVPALVSDLGAPADAIAAWGGGRAVPADDVHAWAEAIRDIVRQPEVLDAWRRRLHLPARIEEECFFYESLYRQLIEAGMAASPAAAA